MTGLGSAILGSSGIVGSRWGTKGAGGGIGVERAGSATFGTSAAGSGTLCVNSLDQRQAFLDDRLTVVVGHGKGTETDEQSVPARDQPLAQHLAVVDLGNVKGGSGHRLVFGPTAGRLAARLRLGAYGIKAGVFESSLGNSHEPRRLAATGEDVRFARRRGGGCTGAVRRDGAMHVHVVDSPNHSILKHHLDQDSLIELATDHRGMPADADVLGTTCRRRLVVVPGGLDDELTIAPTLDRRGRPAL